MEAGSHWQGEYSRWNFNELKQYMMVAKEMLVPGTSTGVPLLDDELNENAEILLTLIRRLVQHAFGNGCDGDGFKIIQSAADPVNNFTIIGGDGTADGAGYIFVEGWLLLLPDDLEYTAQSGVDALTTPSGADRTDEVYLDVYLEEAGPTDDSDIVDPGIGFETSRRIKLTWTVEVAEGGGTPTAYTDANGVPHWTYKIATLSRTDGETQILTAMIADDRNAGRAAKAREYVHTQSAAADTWTINHNLGTEKVMVAVYDGTGILVEPGEVAVVSEDQVTLDFSGTSVAGVAVVKGLTAFV